MNIMNLYVYENRSMSNDLSKPLMLENLNVDNVQIHIPKEIDGTDMGTWAWWFVYQNAKREKYSIPMTLEGTTSDDGEEEYISTVGLNHGFTGKHGTVMYAIEAIQADGSGAVTHEWHTKTYKLEIVYTLQGNQTEYDESESDIISALISRVNELIQSGAEIAEIAETIENAAETAQEVIDSIPADYSALSAQVDTNTEDIGGLKADLGAIESSVITTETKTLTYDDIEWEGGYIKANGDIVTHAAYKVSELLPVSAGDSVVYDGLRTVGNGYIAIAAYDSSEAVQTAKSLTGSDNASMSGTYTVPDGINYIRLSTFVGNTNFFNSVTMPVTTSRFESLDNSLTEIEAEQTAQAAQIAELAQDNHFEYTVTGFEPYDISTSGRVDNHGDVQTHAYSVHSDYISTAGMVSITAHIRGVNNLSSVVAAYDASHNFISSKSIIASDPEAGDGSWCYGDGTITITDDVKYIRLCRGATENLRANDTITVVKYRSFVEDYRNTESRVDALEEKTDSIWKGKKWYAFGTSLTDDRYNDPNGEPTGKYPQFLNEYMQAELVNKGQGGGSITNFNSLIMQKINSTDFSDADLITLEGFPNDYSMPIGDLLDTTMDTLAGAIYTAVTKFYEVAPHATVVLITATQGQLNEQGTAGYPVSFSEGKQLKFNEMTVRMAHYLGCHVIDAGGKAQINNFHPEYLVDHIHHSWAGGKQYADTIWEELKNIHPNTENPYFETESDGE